jgi:hypothetical protein
LTSLEPVSFSRRALLHGVSKYGVFRFHTVKECLGQNANSETIAHKEENPEILSDGKLWYRHSLKHSPNIVETLGQ